MGIEFCNLTGLGVGKGSLWAVLIHPRPSIILNIMFSDSAFFPAYKRQWGISARKGCTAEFMSCISSLFLTQQHKLKQLNVAAGETVRRKVSILRLLLILYNIVVLKYMRHRAVTTSIGRASGALCDTA